MLFELIPLRPYLKSRVPTLGDCFFCFLYFMKPNSPESKVLGSVFEALNMNIRSFDRCLLIKYTNKIHWKMIILRTYILYITTSLKELHWKIHLIFHYLLNVQTHRHLSMYDDSHDNTFLLLELNLKFTVNTSRIIGISNNHIIVTL